MNLYYISQEENDDYDTYSDMVVAANSEDEARLIHPQLKHDKDPKEVWDSMLSSWCSSPDKV